MPVDDMTLQGIRRKDHGHIEELCLSPSDRSKVYLHWYREYIAELERDKRRLPPTTKAIALEAFGREHDRQHLYKNELIRPLFEVDKKRLGQEAKGEKSREEALEEHAHRLDSHLSELQEKINRLVEEKHAQAERIKQLERELRQARLRKVEEKSALEHLFSTGRRVWL